MIGFFVAASCAFGLVVLSLRSRRSGSLWMRGGLYRVFQKLSTTPGQEQVIRTALVKLKEAGRELSAETKAARPEMAELFRRENFDENLVRGWIATRERSFDDFKPKLLDAFREVHEVLDPEQRKKLGDLVESGPQRLFSSRGCGRGRHHGHYGCGAAC